MSEIEIDYLEQGPGPGVTELPSDVQEPPASSRLGVEEGELALYPGWNPQQIDAALKGFGAGVHMLIGQTERDWLMTKEDLERMTPPLVSMLNRWEPSLKLSPLADPILFTYGAVLYVWRNALIDARARKEKAAQLTPREHYDYTGGVPDEVEFDVDGQPAGERPEPYFPESPRAARSQ